MLPIIPVWYGFYIPLQSPFPPVSRMISALYPFGPFICLFFFLVILLGELSPGTSFLCLLSKIYLSLGSNPCFSVTRFCLCTRSHHLHLFSRTQEFKLAFRNISKVAYLQPFLIQLSGMPKFKLQGMKCHLFLANERF